METLDLGAVAAVRDRHAKLAGAADIGRPEWLLAELRTTCQVAVLHPWFWADGKLVISGRSIPFMDWQTDLMIAALSNAVHALYGDEGDVKDNDDIYRKLISRIVATLRYPALEVGLLRYLQRVDGKQLSAKLAELRKLVYRSTVAHYQRARADCATDPFEQIDHTRFPPV